MKNEIIYRNIKRRDYHELAKIISDTWEYDKFCSPKTAHRMGYLYLANCLCEQNYVEIAVKNDIPVGVIMGRIKRYRNKKAKLKFRYMRMKIVSILAMTEEGRKIMEAFDDFDDTDEELLQKSGKDFDAEISFFAVNRRQRGYGIGSTLYNHLIDAFDDENVNSFYIFTDTACDYEFYEKRGAVRIGEYKKDLSMCGYKDFTQFLYVNDIYAK